MKRVSGLVQGLNLVRTIRVLDDQVVISSGFFSNFSTLNGCFKVWGFDKGLKGGSWLESCQIDPWSR